VIKETWLQRWEFGSVARRPGFDVTPVVDCSLRSDTRIHLCGDWFGELGFMEDAAGSATEAAARVEAGLGRSA
jgi:protoporphyrinogen/coproporphyrinogen III oxidase